MAELNMEMTECLRVVWSTLGRTEREVPGATYDDFVRDLAYALAGEMPAGHPLRLAADWRQLNPERVVRERAAVG